MKPALELAFFVPEIKRPDMVHLVGKVWKNWPSQFAVYGLLGGWVMVMY